MLDGWAWAGYLAKACSMLNLHLEVNLNVNNNSKSGMDVYEVDMRKRVFWMYYVHVKKNGNLEIFYIAK